MICKTGANIFEDRAEGRRAGGRGVRRRGQDESLSLAGAFPFLAVYRCVGYTDKSLKRVGKSLSDERCGCGRPAGAGQREDNA